MDCDRLLAVQFVYLFYCAEGGGATVRSYMENGGSRIIRGTIFQRNLNEVDG